MQIHLAGHHVEITPALNEAVETKLKKLEDHFSHITHIYTTLRVEKHVHTAEAEVSLSGTKNKIFAEAKSNDMYASIDDMVHKLDRQIIKHKEKLTKKNHDKDML